MSNPEQNIIDEIGFLIQMYGASNGFSNCTIDSDSNSSSIVFTYEHEGEKKSYLLSSQDIKEA